MRSLHVLHGFIVIAASTAWTPRQVRDFSLDIDLFSLKQSVDNLSQLQVPGAEPAKIASLVLGLGLQPEQVPLGAGRELQDVDPPIGGRLGACLWGLVWCEGAI